MNILEDRFPLPDAHKQAVTSPTSLTAASSTVTFPVEAEQERLPTPPKMFKRKALLIGVQEVPGFNVLKGPHRDVRSMRQLLIDVYKYAPEDIGMLIDANKPKQKQPTRENIVRAFVSRAVHLPHGSEELDEIEKLVKDAKEHDRFFFHFSGHSGQEETKDIEEEDRMDEFILTSDGEKIKDNELRAKLAKPLPTGSSFIAIFDSCHSGTLLDLIHYRCNRVYVPWISKGNRRTNSLWNANKRKLAYMRASGNLPRNQPSYKTPIDGVALNYSHDSLSNSLPNHTEVPTGDLKHATALSVITEPVSAALMFLDSPTQYKSPEILYCTGLDCSGDLKLYAVQDPLHADVISISSAQDNQITWEDPVGRSMTQILVKILRDNKHPTYRELMTRINHEIYDYYVDMHTRARDYKKLVHEANAAKIKKGKQPKEGDVVEMNNFQEPQLSTDRPLDMSRPFDP